MTGIVFVTQLIDPDDPVLGFVVPLVRALGRKAERLVVIANEVRFMPDDLGFEVVSLGKEGGAGRSARALRYQVALVDACRRLQPATLVAHMCPSYLTLAAPVMKLTGTGSMLWFTHPRDTPALRRAEWLSGAVLTALPGSYPRSSPKVRAIGHSIDTARFALQPPRSWTGPVPLLAVGRLSAVKNYPVMIQALVVARRRGVEAELRIVGPVTTSHERDHRRALQEMVETARLKGAVHLMGDVTPSEVPGLLSECAALVSATTTGSADKVVFEAMACGRPPLTCSTAFRDLLGGVEIDLTFEQGDIDGLADRICAIALAGPEVLGRVGVELRSRVEQGHSLEHWAERVVALAGSRASVPGRA